MRKALLGLLVFLALILWVGFTVYSDFTETRQLARQLGEPTTILANNWRWGWFGGADTTTVVLSTDLTPDSFANLLQTFSTKDDYVSLYGSCQSRLYPITDLPDHEITPDVLSRLNVEPDFFPGMTITSVNEPAYLWYVRAPKQPQKYFSVYYFSSTNQLSWILNGRQIRGNAVIFQMANKRWRHVTPRPIDSSTSNNEQNNVAQDVANAC